MDFFEKAGDLLGSVASTAKDYILEKNQIEYEYAMQQASETSTSTLATLPVTYTQPVTPPQNIGGVSLTPTNIAIGVGALVLIAIVLRK